MERTPMQGTLVLTRAVSNEASKFTFIFELEAHFAVQSIHPPPKNPTPGCGPLLPRGCCR
jgi:hypothetical protein